MFLQNEDQAKNNNKNRRGNVLPNYLQAFFIQTAEISQFVIRFLKELFLPPYEFKEVLKQCYKVGYKSLPLIVVTGFIMGLVLTLQSRPTLVSLGAEAWLPQMVTVSIIREIGPVITALICAGKIGSGIGAELGSMKVTEQIDAMEVSGTHPFKYIVVTRILATTCMIPVLVVFADAVSLYGSYIGINISGQISLYFFFSKAIDSLAFSDIMPAIIKTFFFGFAIGLIGCYKGYYSNEGTEGVGMAANSAVVMSSLLVFIIDMIAVQLTNLFIY